ncbi:FKBP-type peptidyl-prolyl cis-trans isomerase [Myceligenerans xiligouense]|uniref:peptidylprolyl isomerase n=1 Tax=Myceligenerans xiligouense TaxID=253184 RepID=A0A3N4YL88_9MICO|nr:FKBP-type peptidyl-prolyl cis-trans isomerase [Myceligenerans xiligouense]RPF20196.1 peptidylprolyl isomerase [Myceligenerans xiligouense]
MKHRTTAGLVAFALGSALVLTGCGDGDDSGDADASPSPSADASGAGAEPIVAGGVCEPEAAQAEGPPEATEADQEAVQSVEVAGQPGKKPSDVSFETPLAVEGVAVNVLDEGDGAQLEQGGKVTFHDYGVSGEDGKPFQGEDGQPRPSTWDEGQSPQEFALGDPSFQILNDPLTGLNVGARVVIAWQGMEGATEVHVVDVVDAEPAADPVRAEGTAVEPEAGLPTVELADNGAPTVTIAEDFEEPSELVVQPLIEGDGREITKDDEVTAHYLGCLVDGTPFDSSWSRFEPTPFALTQVIEGWTEGLAGQKIGSQVMLVVPAEQAYGTDPNAHQLGGKTLIFVVDIIEAKKAA